jgi:hypothetical protein
MRHDVAEDLNAERHNRENLESCTYVHVILEAGNRRLGEIRYCKVCNNGMYGLCEVEIEA